MENIERKQWIEKNREKYQVDKLGRLGHAEEMLNEAETSYIYGIYYGCIFCIHSAFSSYLIQRLGVNPKLKGNIVRIEGLKILLRKVDFLSNQIKEEISEFSRIRGNLEHPKSPLEILFADWKNDTEDGSATLRMKEIEKSKDGIWFDPVKTAKNGLITYYKMCKEIYDHLID
jgi:hypothetical protein